MARTSIEWTECTWNPVTGCSKISEGCAHSMSDLFHEDVPFSFIESVMATIRSADQHVFQILTKRAERLREFERAHEWPGNLILGVTVENADTADRIDFLRSTRARTKFISFEPLIASVGSPDLQGIDWVIVGGESGPGARPMELEWVREIKSRSRDLGIPFFFKQWGGFLKKRNGRILEGRTWDERPVPYADARLCPDAS